MSDHQGGRGWRLCNGQQQFDISSETYCSGCPVHVKLKSRQACACISASSTPGAPGVRRRVLVQISIFKVPCVCVRLWPVLRCRREAWEVVAAFSSSVSARPCNSNFLSAPTCFSKSAAALFFTAGASHDSTATRIATSRAVCPLFACSCTRVSLSQASGVASGHSPRVGPNSCHMKTTTVHKQRTCRLRDVPCTLSNKARTMSVCPIIAATISGV